MPPHPDLRPRRARLVRERRRVRRRVVVAAVIIVGLLGGTGYGLDWLSRTEAATPYLRPPAPAVTPGPMMVAPVQVPTRPPATTAPPVLSLPGEIPDSGPGTLRLATGTGEELGESGPLRRFRVAVEDGIDVDPAELAGFVEETLAEPRQGWTVGGEARFQRVADGADFTVYLVTSGTTAQMCGQGGLDVVGGGLPEGGVSCRLAGQVILNLHRWWRSVPQYVDAEVPLATYRQMLVNHEVGHELGYEHEECPGSGQPAPVMQQQTLRLDGCEANPWPYLDGVRYSGPPAL